MKYFRIKNWEKYQHRDAIRGRGPMVFVRVDTNILSDPKLYGLSVHDELTWYKLLPYSGRTRNRLPYDSHIIKAELRLKWLPNLALFEELGLIELIDASKLPASCQPRGEERRGEQRKGEEIRLSLANARSSTNVESEPILKGNPNTKSKDKSKDSSLALDLFGLWNKQCGSLAKMERMTEKRKKRWAACLKQNTDEAYWVKIIRWLSEDPFFSGANGKWSATVDYLLQPDKHVELFERLQKAKYDGRSADEMYQDQQKGMARERERRLMENL